MSTNVDRDRVDSPVVEVHFAFLRTVRSLALLGKPFWGEGFGGPRISRTFRVRGREHTLHLLAPFTLLLVKHLLKQ
jgi:hypothetical protein